MTETEYEALERYGIMSEDSKLSKEEIEGYIMWEYGMAALLFVKKAVEKVESGR